jgi:hypothetical protein
MEFFSSEVTSELEHLHMAMDAFLDFLGVASGAREAHLWNTCRHVLGTIKSGIRHGVRVALAMVEVLVEADLTGVSGFPRGRSCATTRN